MGFDWPWIYLLLPLPALLLWWRGRHSHGRAIALPPSVTAALSQIDAGNRGLSSVQIRWLLLAVAWLSLLTAIAQPYRNDASVAQPASGRALTVLIDLSTSMERRDFTLNDEAVDRLTVVKNIAGQFITRRHGDRIGLVLFGTEAFIAAPLSYDVAAVNTILQSSGIGMAGRTTAMGDALGLAIKTLRTDPAAEKAIVLLSDGTNNAGRAEPEDAATLAGSLGIVVHTIGLGSDEPGSNLQQFRQAASADLDEATLQSIAEVSGGQFFRAQTSQELKRIYQQIDRLQGADVIAPPLIIKKDYRNLFILTVLFCLMALVVPGLHRSQTT